MAKFYTAFFLFFIIFLGFGQDSNLYYRGDFFNKKNKPEAFLKVKNLRTGIVELTDSNGDALIQAQVGDTLVWNEKNSLIIQNKWQLGELLELIKREQKYQTVEPIVSKDYKSQLQQGKVGSLSTAKTMYRTSKNSNLDYYNNVRSIKEVNDSILQVKRIVPKELVFNARYFSSTEVKWQNGLPKLQNEFIQGRSSSNGLVYYGPNTNEIYSFGPSIQDFSFDVHGNLAPNLGLQKSASPQSNSLFKPLVNFENSLYLSTILKKENLDYLKLDLRFKQKYEPQYFLNEYTKLIELGGKLIYNPTFLKATISFDHSTNSATNSNRFGYYNWIFKNSLITPISFNNKNEFLVDKNLHRRFSNQFDNPYYLDFQNENWLKSYSNSWDLQLEKKFSSYWKASMNGSFAKERTFSLESYPSSSTNFPTGFSNEREVVAEKKAASAMVYYENRNNDLEHYVTAKYLYQDDSKNIFASANQGSWFYQRETNEFVLNYQPKFSFGDFTIKGQLTNNFYKSSTAPKSQSWNPVGIFDISARTNGGSILGLNTQYSDLNSEVNFGNSWSYYKLTQHDPSTSFQYFPLNEVETVKGLDYLRRIKRGFGAYFNRRNNLSLEVQYFNTSILNDVVPYFSNDKLYLKNSFDHQSEGVDLAFKWYNIFRNYRFNVNSGISFLTYKDRVTRTESGFEDHPIIGFKTVFTGLKKGFSVGSIFGNSILKDSSGNPIIDAKGFPIQNPDVEIIGDAIPDFIMKMTHSVQLNTWIFALNWEWSKGGDIWNGTQASLDYYGRSAQSSKDRLLQNYVFQGIHANGVSNTIPVDFYNPNLPISENRWVRYGESGIPKWYIEDASFLRISSVSLSKRFQFTNEKKGVRMLTLSLFTNNILLWKKYSGVQPQNNFFEANTGQGLDFFCPPGFTSLGMSLNVEL